VSTLEVWTVQKLVQWTANHFSSKQIESARLDAELLLSHVLKCKRLDLYMNLQKPVLPSELASYRELVKRRALKEPVAYLTGEQEFYGRTFKVGADVLIPRPETEELVGEVFSFLKAKADLDDLSVLDIGAGSGCIGLTLAAEFKNIKVKSLDVSERALELTRENAERLQVSDRLEFLLFDFEKFESDEKFNVVVSNPPYIGLKNVNVMGVGVMEYEPKLALFGGDKGHELIARWASQMVGFLKPGGLLALEIGFDQGKIIEEIFSSQKNLTEVQIKKDYSGHCRIARAIKTGN
jgi:release factor glutamine methyltransferase